MTLCIAAMCDVGRTIATVSDFKISTDSYSADTVAMKIFPLTDDWGVMFAGDIGKVSPIMYTARAAVSKSQQCSLPKMSAAFVRAFEAQLRENATHAVLGRWGIGLNRFLRDGKKMFPIRQYKDLYEQITSEQIEADFLVFGFDEKEVAHVFEVSDGSGLSVSVRYHDPVGFGSIGNGTTVAESSLFFHSYNWRFSLNRAVYVLCAAKFMAESVVSEVGRETFVFIHKPKQRGFCLLDCDIESLRRIWTDKGKPRIPENLDASVGNILDRAEADGLSIMKKRFPRIKRRKPLR